MNLPDAGAPASASSTPANPSPAARGAVPVVIPAYQPTPKLLALVDELLASDASWSIVIVDDGSGEAARPVFDAVQQRHRVTLLRHAVNLGKGQALKTAFNHLLCTSSATTMVGVVTADCDGQHLPRDIVRLAQALRDDPTALILGTRSLRGSIPWKSRVGNSLTRAVFRGFVGRSVEDTQTGLRALPAGFLPELLRIPASGYEFELEMLIRGVRRHMHFVEVPIETIYEDDNRGTHFNPIRDSLRIYFVFFRFLLLSMATAVVDFAVFGLVFLASSNVALSTAAARLVAGTFNFKMARTAVFHSSDRSYWPLVKYVLLVLWLAVVSYGLVTVLVAILDVGVFWAKALAESLLFIASFVIQRALVFGRVTASERVDA